MTAMAVATSNGVWEPEPKDKVSSRGISSLLKPKRVRCSATFPSPTALNKRTDTTFFDLVNATRIRIGPSYSAGEFSGRQAFPEPDCHCVMGASFIRLAKV